LIALIANARRSRIASKPQSQGSTLKKTFPIDSAVYGPRHSPYQGEREARVGLFRKDQFCFKRTREPKRSS
jgi:hypothetical protein